MYYIGFDLGSSSVKAALIDSSTGKSVGITQFPETEMAIVAEQTGWAEQDPNLWWKNIGQVTKKLLTQTGVSSKKIKGIGNSFSARIVKYRTDLGGFVSKEQLKEVYGLDEELYAKIEPHLLPISAETMLPKLNINAATAEMLWRHPYITPTIAKGMVKYRKQHGKFKRIEDLKKLYLIDDELYDKIKVYFRID